MASTSFRFKDGEPTLELRRSSNEQWTEHRYTDEDWIVTDWRTLPGMDRMVFVTTSHEKVGVVELMPEVKATVLEADVCDDPYTGVTVYFADVYDDVENEIAGVVFSVERDQRIVKLDRMF